MIQDQEWVAPVIQQPGSDAFESMVYSSKIESEPKYPNRSYCFPIFLYLYIIQVITPVWKGTLVPFHNLAHGIIVDCTTMIPTLATNSDGD